MTTHKITVLDGGMSRELQRLGAPFKQPEWSALAMIETPEIVKEVHKAFIASGSQVITTNSYALVPFHIGEERFQQQGQSLAALAGKMARNAIDETQTGTRVAGSIPPLFGSYRADLYEPDKVADIAKPLIGGLSPYVDLWLCETQSVIDEVRRVKELIDQMDQQHKPVWVSFTLVDYEPTSEPVLRSGETVAEAVAVMAGLGVSAILFNCCMPEIISAAIKVAREVLESLQVEQIQIGAYANAFASQPKDATANDGLDEVRADLTPGSYLTWAQQWRDEGASLIGGCCGIGAEHIARLAEAFG